MKDELEQLMSAATGRADYAGVRHVASNVERITTRNGAVDEVDRSESAGPGARVRVGGGWGFAARRDATRAGLEVARQRAIGVPAAQPSSPRSPLADEPPA